MRSAKILALCMAIALVGEAIAGDPPPKDVDLQALAARLSDADADVRLAATTAFVRAGEAASGVLEPIAADAGSPRTARAAAHALAAIRKAKRLAARKEGSVLYWTDVQEVLDTETDPVREAVLESGLRDAYLAGVAVEHLSAGNAVAAAFCREWASALEPPQDPAARERLRDRLVAAGNAAAPYLLRVVGHDPLRAGFLPIGHPDQTMSAKRAVDALAILKVREAVPFLLFQATGPSMALDSVAESAIDSLTGTRFATGESGVWGHVFGLEDATRPMVDWWNAHRAEYDEGTGLLVRQALAEARSDLARRVATGAPPEGVRYGDGHLEPYENEMAKRLRLVVGADLPLHFEGDARARLAAVRDAEAWAETRFPR